MCPATSGSASSRGSLRLAAVARASLSKVRYAIWSSHDENFPADVQFCDPPGTKAVARSTGGNAYQTNTSSNIVFMNFQTLPLTGSSLPHNNLMPYLTLNYCIALQGIFPQRW